MQHLLRRGLNALLMWLLIPLVLIEEWGWVPLQALADRLARWGPLVAVDRRIAAMSPYAALTVLLLPALALLPLKLVGLWLLSRGWVLWSLLLMLVSKLAGTAVLAHLFVLTKPALMTLPWFARLYVRWTAWKDDMLARVRGTVVWAAARRARAALTRLWRAR